MIKVLIVDDSSFMRQELSRIVSTDPDLDVIGTAFDGNNALEKIERLKPDVVTLDIEMPGMDGLTALKHIMINNPMPVVVISSLTQSGADTTFEALRLGAVDIIAKPSGTISLDIKRQTEEITTKIKAAHEADCSKIKKVPVTKDDEKIVKPKKILRPTKCNQIVAIGVSTGGPQTLMNIIPLLPADLSASILIVQHMPPVFTKNFADRLNRMSNVSVKEAEDRDKIANGQVFVAPGDFHMTLNKNGLDLGLSKKPDDTLHRPAVDVMMDSVVNNFKYVITGVLLTGMGKDGAQGLLKIRNKGGKTIAESESTAVVYGMPREAKRLDAVDFILGNDSIAGKIIELVNTH